MTDEVRSLREDLNELQQLIDEYKSQAPARVQIEPSILAPRQLDVSDTPRSCIDQKHGLVLIQIAPDVEPFYVNCDQNFRDGGWLVIANRFDGSEDFNREWLAYKTGFGALNSEFFIGLDKLHRLTNSMDHELLIIMRSKTKEERFAIYDQFSIGSEAEKYYLYVLGTYRGDSGDSLRYHSGKKFTTYDQDNDDNAQNCARSHTGGWWYGRECLESNLFGTFQPTHGQEIGYFKGILWKTFVPGPTGSLRYVRMLIRPYKKTQ
ncbi:angiopoietin-related protein 1 isoform X2 [Drosophila grimshawi]|nr:angiopoietin-related protein 1 isoform X2 [Drosophila grimshawi]